MSDQYVATIVEVPGHGIKLEPAAGSVTPTQVDDIHLLILAVALALGRGGYDHHPEPRDPATQVLEGVLDGSSVLPWRAASDTMRDVIVCDLGDKGMPRCRLIQAPDDRE
jgi:hypothetical protein